MANPIDPRLQRDRFKFVLLGKGTKKDPNSLKKPIEPFWTCLTLDEVVVKLEEKRKSSAEGAVAARKRADEERDPEKKKEAEKCTREAEKKANFWLKYKPRVTNYRYDSEELLEHMAKGGNYGILTGVGGFMVLDSDNLQRWQELGVLDPIQKKKMPAVESRPGHRQYYFFCPDSLGGCSLKDPENGKPIGDLKAVGGQVVAPGCMHPSGSVYKVVEDFPIPEISGDELRQILGMFKTDANPKIKIEGNGCTCDHASHAGRTSQSVQVPSEDMLKDPRYREAAVAYAMRALEDEALDVRFAEEGYRNKALNNAALKIGHYVGAGHLKRDEVEKMLLESALEAGLSKDEAKATINSGLTKGISQPKNPVLKIDPDPEMPSDDEPDSRSGKGISEPKNPLPKIEPDSEMLSEDELAAIPLAENPRLEVNLEPGNAIMMYIDYGKKTSDAYPEYHYGNALVLLATATNRNLVLSMAQGKLYPNIWVFELGRSTISRKSAAMSKADMLAEDLFPQIALPQSYSPEGMVQQLSETPRAYLLKDEAGAMLAAMGKQYMDEMRDLYCTLYDCRGYSRKLRSSQRKEKTAFNIKDPFINIACATTPETFREYTSMIDLTSGWLIRFLFFYPNYKKPWMGFRPADAQDFDLYGEVMGRFATVKGKFFDREEPLEITLCPEAWDYYQEWQKDREIELQKTTGDLNLALFGRLTTYALKSSLLFTVGRSDYQEGMQVSLEHITEACRQIDEYFLPTGRAVIEEVARQEERNLQNKIIGTLSRAGGKMSQRDLLRALHVSLREVGEAFNALEASEEIELRKTTKGVWVLRKAGEVSQVSQQHKRPKCHTNSCSNTGINVTSVTHGTAGTEMTPETNISDPTESSYCGEISTQSHNPSGSTHTLAGHEMPDPRLQNLDLEEAKNWQKSMVTPNHLLASNEREDPVCKEAAVPCNEPEASTSTQIPEIPYDGIESGQGENLDSEEAEEAELQKIIASICPKDIMPKGMGIGIDHSVKDVFFWWGRPVSKFRICRDAECLTEDVEIYMVANGWWPEGNGLYSPPKSWVEAGKRAMNKLMRLLKDGSLNNMKYIVDPIWISVVLSAYEQAKSGASEAEILDKINAEFGFVGLNFCANDIHQIVDPLLHIGLLTTPPVPLEGKIGVCGIECDRDCPWADCDNYMPRSEELQTPPTREELEAVARSLVKDRRTCRDGRFIYMFRMVDMLGDWEYLINEYLTSEGFRQAPAHGDEEHYIVPWEWLEDELREAALKELKNYPKQEYLDASAVSEVVGCTDSDVVAFLEAEGWKRCDFYGAFLYNAPEKWRAKARECVEADTVRVKEQITQVLENGDDVTIDKLMDALNISGYEIYDIIHDELRWDVDEDYFDKVWRPNHDGKSWLPAVSELRQGILPTQDQEVAPTSLAGNEERDPAVSCNSPEVQTSIGAGWSEDQLADANEEKEPNHPKAVSEVVFSEDELWSEFEHALENYPVIQGNRRGVSVQSIAYRLKCGHPVVVAFLEKIGCTEGEENKYTHQKCYLVPDTLLRRNSPASQARA